MKKKGFTLIELLVVVAIIAMLLAILMPALNKVKKIAQRVICGTNLKGLGNAMVVYSQDYDGQYVCQGQRAGHTWGRTTNGWANPAKNWKTQVGDMTIASNLYLLVRLADVSPKSFVCPSSDQTEFSGRNPSNFDIVELWDFGVWNGATAFPNGAENEGPENCVSYSYHQPFQVVAPSAQAGRYRADDQRSAAFALMGDKNPWFDPKLKVHTGTGQFPTDWLERVSGIGDHWMDSPVDGRGTQRQLYMIGNAQPHEREGQNVMFADGHNSFSKTPDVGVKNDNVYTIHLASAASPVRERVGDKPSPAPTRTAGKVIPQGLEDSMLVNDFGAAIR